MPRTLPQASETIKRKDPVAFLCGDWMDAQQLSISMFDAGFRQGVTAVERLRTYDQAIFAKQAHLDRWLATTGALQISGLPPVAQISDLLEELLQRNKSIVDQWRETGITMIATPGTDQITPTLAMHLNRIDLDKVGQRQQHGQPLIVTDVVQPPPESWSRSLKVRCRLHYYRADMIARGRDPEAIGVLRDVDGTITETSVANIAIVAAERIVSPPPDRVLGGITQAAAERIAARLDIAWERRPITVDELGRADEVLLMGTDGGIWFACSVDGQPPGDNRRRVQTRLLTAFPAEVRHCTGPAAGES